MLVKEFLEFIEARREEGIDIDNFEIQFSDTTSDRRTNDCDIVDMAIEYSNVVTLY